MTSVFIVGAPRSGSTLLYQAVTNSYDVLYPDNLASLFRGAISTGVTCSRRFFGGRPHDCFRSTRGRTWRCGLHAPNEMERVFTRVLPHGSRRGIVSERLRAITNDIGIAVRTFGRPIVFKSLRVGQHIAATAEALPESRFVFIRRDPILTAQSIAIACDEERAPTSAPWYVRPRHDELLTGLTGARLIVRQIHLIEQEIARELALLDAARHTTVWYRDLCHDVPATIASVASRLPDVPHRRHHRTPRSVSHRDTRRLPRRDFEELVQCANELDWTFAGD